MGTIGKRALPNLGDIVLEKLCHGLVDNTCGHNALPLGKAWLANKRLADTCSFAKTGTKEVSHLAAPRARECRLASAGYDAEARLALWKDLAGAAHGPPPDDRGPWAGVDVGGTENGFHCAVIDSGQLVAQAHKRTTSETIRLAGSPRPDSYRCR